MAENPPTQNSLGLSGGGVAARAGIGLRLRPTGPNPGREAAAGGDDDRPTGGPSAERGW